MITSDYVQKQIDKAKTASSQANLFQGKIAKLKGFVPPIELQDDFLSFVKQVDKSRFVEMFGDISTEKYKYVIKKLGDVAKVGSSHRVFTTDFG